MLCLAMSGGVACCVLRRAVYYIYINQRNNIKEQKKKKPAGRDRETQRERILIERKRYDYEEP